MIMITTEPVIIMSLECIQPESSQFGHDWVGGESPVGAAGGCDGGVREVGAAGKVVEEGVGSNPLRPSSPLCTCP